MDLLNVLVEKKILTSEQSAEVYEKSQERGDFAEAVIDELKFANSDEVAKTKSEILNIPLKKIADIIPREILEHIPEESAQHYGIVPISVTDDVLEVGAINPDSIEVRDVLNFISSKIGMPYKVFVISNADFQKILAMYRGLKVEVKEALSELESEFNIKPGRIEGAENEISDIGDHTSSREQKERMKIIEDAPVTKIVATILRYATDGNASDVHVEPLADNTRVRFRVDGDLNTSLILPKNVHSAVSARIKVLSNMKLDEKRRPQDGRFSAKIDDRKIDFRVSTFPTYHGEKVVMRILDSSQGIRTLDDMGLREENVEKLRKAIKSPYGIILLSGPTGSGKTTTLYAMLQEVDRDRRNVLSLEDPVEYNVQGVSQSQVRADIDYTFANGLRTILRQDPDIIMVGEIRDKETAQLAIQAALTGHLVLSTIHTNSSIGTIPRLVDMGIDPYLIAPTLKMSIAQRLAKTLCNGAGREEEIDKSTQMRIDKAFKSLPKKYYDRIPTNRTVLHPQPIPTCQTGYRGRTAITEVLEINEEMQELILKNASEEEFFQAARKNGFITIQEDAIIKALNHEIPFEEMNTFTTKINTDLSTEEGYDTVDNLTDVAVSEAIMNDDEITFS